MSGQGGRRADGEIRITCSAEVRGDWIDTKGQMQSMLRTEPTTEQVLRSLLTLWKMSGPDARKRAMVTGPEPGFQPG